MKAKLKTLICLLIGCNEELVHSGAFEYENPKQGESVKVMEGSGKVYQCRRCGYQRVEAEGGR